MKVTYLEFAAAAGFMAFGFMRAIDGDAITFGFCFLAAVWVMLSYYNRIWRERYHKELMELRNERVDHLLR